MKNCLKIWPKLVEADREAHEVNNLAVPSSLAEWVAYSLNGRDGRDITPEAAPLISMKEMKKLLRAHGTDSTWGQAMNAVMDKEIKKK